MNILFPPELRTASVVPRWAIVRTLSQDNVAIHSYFVTYYALQIARLIQWQGPLADLMFYALTHDIEETFTGDWVSPVKKAVTDPGALSNFISQQMKERLPLIEGQLETIMESQHGVTIEKIVKVADKADAALYLIMEQRMGNTVLAGLFADACNNLFNAWVDLCEHYDVQSRERLWDDEIYPAIQAHWKYGGIGI